MRVKDSFDLIDLINDNHLISQSAYLGHPAAGRNLAFVHWRSPDGIAEARRIDANSNLVVWQSLRRDVRNQFTQQTMDKIRDVR